MPEDVPMPRLSDSMEEGTVISWMKSVGDRVEVGEELVEIETDKANMAYEADRAGELSEILVEEGATVAVGEPIARIAVDDAAAAEPAPSAPSPDPTTAPQPSTEPAAPKPAGVAAVAAGPPATIPADPPVAADPGRPRATPIARRIARKLGVDLTAVAGSGPGGRVVKLDVERAAGLSSPEQPRATAAQPAGPAQPADTAKGEPQILELSRLQQTVSRRMADSKQTVPHFYLSTEIDMTRAVAARARLKAVAGEGDLVPSVNDMVVKACALALRDFPRVNASYGDGTIELYPRINVGVAVAADDALVVPTIFDADAKGLAEIAQDARSLAAKVRDGSVTPPELSGGTFTVSNLGMYGISAFDAIVNLPQAAILAVGSIRRVPMVRGEEIVPGETMTASLSCDHRVIYGADGAEFLARVRELLEEPLRLAL